jgi:hypothetical protein
MSGRRGDEPLISYFFYVLFAAAVAELVANRAFLASVIPVGVTGVNIHVLQAPLTALYFVGGKAYSLLNIFVPATLVAFPFLRPKSSPLRGEYLVLLVCAVGLALLMDAQHVAAGISSSYQNASALESSALIYIVILTVLVTVYYVHALGKWFWLSLGLMLVTDVLGLFYVVGNIETAAFSTAATTYLANQSANLEPYTATVGGLLFAVFGARLIWKRRGARWVEALCAALTLSATLEYLVMTNALPGSATVLGTIIIYVFGFLGVTDQMVPFLVFSAFCSFIVSVFLMIALRKKDRSGFFLGLGAALLVITGLVFDSENTTTYLLMPLAACASLVLSADIRNRMKIRSEAKMDGKEILSSKQGLP